MSLVQIDQNALYMYTTDFAAGVKQHERVDTGNRRR